MPLMNPLRLSPLPSIRANDEPGSLLMESEGFVDEAVVKALMSGPDNSRRVAYPEDLALAAGDLDFAGWQLSPSVPVRRAAEVPPHVIDAIIRRAAPPVFEESGIGTPHHGKHRWWLAGMAGVLSTMLFSVLLLTLSSRPGTPFETLPSPGGGTAAKPASPRTTDFLQVSPELTDVSTHRP